MHTIQTALPRRELAKLCSRFCSTRRLVLGPEPGIQAKPISRPLNISSRSTSTTLSRLHYTNGRSKLVPPIHVVGSQTAPSSGARTLDGYRLDFGIFLKPLASWQLFRIPPAVFANENGDGRLSSERHSHVVAAVVRTKTSQERIKVAEDYLLAFAIDALPKTSVMESAQYACLHNGAVRIQDLATLVL